MVSIVSDQDRDYYIRYRLRGEKVKTLYCKFGTEMKNEADIHGYSFEEEIRDLGVVKLPGWLLKTWA